MLTYEVIRKTVNDEKNTPKLIKLPDNFLEQVRIYFDKKSRIDRGKEDAWELESAKRLLKDLLDIRERKTLTLALYYVKSGTDPGTLMEEEREFFNNIVNMINDFQKKRKDILTRKQEKRMVVTIEDDLSEFVGHDMKTYGPFRKGDITTLPVKSAKLLISKNIAKEIKMTE